MSDDGEDEFDKGLGDDPEVSAPPPRSYDGWHLPRKQVVRHAQWAEPLKALLDKRPESTGTVKYLGLPGRDLLDIRYLIDKVCAPFGRQMMFLGFDRTAEPKLSDNSVLNSAYADLMRSPQVDKASVIKVDDVNQIARIDTQVFRDAEAMAPFDVVNLDFCEPVLGRARDDVQSVYPLLKRILSLQRTKNEWLLLITSRIDQASFTGDALSALLPLLNANRRTCLGFDALLSDQMELSSEATEDEVRDLEPADFFTLVPFLLGKWLLREVNNLSRLKVLSTLGYAIHRSSDNDSMDMLSMAIQIKPRYENAGDSAGMVDPDDIDECEDAISLATSLLRLESIDEYLNSDAATAERFTRDSVELMRSANHPVGPYLQFLAEHGVDVSTL